MIKKYIHLFYLFFSIAFASAQTTETFETETDGSTTFTDNGQVFNIIPGNPDRPFYIQASYPGTGWNGTSADNIYIDNDGNANFNIPATVTIATANGTPFNLKRMWLYLSTQDANDLNVTGSVTITGKLAGVTKFTVVRNSSFNSSVAVNNGFTLFDMTNTGGQDTSNISIDQYTISTTEGINYVSIDAMRWQCATPSFASTSQTNVSCNGGSNGTATAVSATAGVTYNWTPGNPAGDGTPTITGLAPGTYTCTLTSNCGSTTSASFTIIQPALLTTTTSQTNVSCYGTSTGVASVTASGGTGTYTYSWSPGGSNSATRTGLAAGNYTVTVTDTNGCSSQKTFAITQPATPLSASQSNTNVLCYGAATATATVSVSGGTLPYSYSWSPSGGTGATANGLAQGTYTVTVTDANGCTLQKSYTITQPSALTAETTVTNIACSAGNSGAIDLTPAGGTQPYSYIWTDGAVTQDRSGLAAGTYTVTITDSNGCTLQKSSIITQPSAITATQSQTNVLCNGAATGTASVTVSGGTPGYSYAWSPAGGTAATATGLTAGNYTVLITDTNGCSLQKSFTITQPSALTGTTVVTHVACYGGNNGAINLTVGGGVAPYTYSWTGGSTAQDPTGLLAGTYTVIITDSAGCSLQTSTTITQPELVTATQSQSNILCNGSSTGTASVFASGGTAPYTYSWFPSGGNSASATGLAAGNYIVTITDNNGCSIQKNFAITQSSPLTATHTQTNVLCNGASTGAATVAVSGGIAPYTYWWSNNSNTTATATGLVAGTYNVIVTDAAGCTLQKTIVINESNAMSVVKTQTNVVCLNTYTGSASVAVSGGSGTYTYYWFPTEATTPSVSNLYPGAYTVTITDSNGCTTQADFFISQPAGPIATTITTTDVLCNGGSTGSASITSEGGNGGPYTYSWAPAGGNAATATGLLPGTYTVTITDVAGCSAQRTITINEPTPLSIEFAPASAGCDGTATAYGYASGGAGYYTYSWTGSDSTEDYATGLEQGTYTLTVTDLNGCTAQQSITVTGATDCSSYTYWNGSTWSNGAPTCFSVSAVIYGNYNSAVHGEITACSLSVNNGTVTVAAGDNFTIKGSIYAEGGTLIFESNSNLVQVDNVSNYGNIIYKCNSSLLYGNDYTLWSSPVSGSQTLKDFSPGTLDERFLVYNTVLGAYSNYLSASGVFGGNPNQETFDIGKGYLIRMPDGLSGNTTSVFEGIFAGNPNNGDITVPTIGSGSRYNAIGNPYPSPINVKDFLLANSQYLDNGTIYLWRKRNGSTGTAYATVTLAAYVAATAEGGDTSAGAFEDGDEDNWVINPGQGFQVKVAPEQEFIFFNNSMRRAVNNGQFFKVANMAAASPQNAPDMSKMWINITDGAGLFGQAAIVYSDVTTLGLDYGYDGRLFNDGVLSVYSMAGDTRLSIQARDVFTIADEVPVGFKATTAGNYIISIDHITGLFEEGQAIYLRDNLLNSTHDLTTSGGYAFTADAGTVNDRFDIVYAPALSLDTLQQEANNIIVYKKENVIAINSGSIIINAIRVFDVRGRLLYEQGDMNTSKAEIKTLVAEQQVLIVQVTGMDGRTTSKKIIY